VEYSGQHHVGDRREETEVGLLGNLFGQQKGLTAREAKTLKLVAALSAEKKHVVFVHRKVDHRDSRIVDHLRLSSCVTS